MPVTGFGVPGTREDRRADRGLDVCSRCLAVSWIQQLKSLASTRDARSHATPTRIQEPPPPQQVTRIRPQRRSRPPGRQQIPQEHRHRLHDPAVRPDHPIWLMGIARGHETARPRHHEPRQVTPPSLPPIRSRGQASARDRKPAMNCGNIGVRSVNGASAAPCCAWTRPSTNGSTAIRDNLAARIAEAQREGWTGEAEGLNVSLAAASNKLR